MSFAYERLPQSARPWKYRLTEDYKISTGIMPDHSLSDRYFRLDRIGQLTVRAGYAWDGASGPAIDTPAFMRGSCVHDALCQMIRWRILPAAHQRAADRLLVRLCREDGMSLLRALWVYYSVRAYQRLSRRWRAPYRRLK